MRKFLLAATFLAAPLLAASGARAAIITIGLQAAGVNGGAITTEASGAGNASFSSAYGAFQVNNVSGTGTPFLASPNFDTNAINATTTSAGTLDVFITESGLTTPVGPLNLMSSFTENAITAGWTATVSSWEDNSNGIFSEVTPLYSSTFSAIGTVANIAAVDLASLYSITVEYALTSNGAGSSNATANVTNVPEPASLALLGSGLFAVGMIRRRRAATTA